MKTRSSIEITRSVIFALVLREGRSRVGRRRLGAFWMLVEPLLHLLLFTVVMSTIRGRHVAGLEYPVFLLVGLAPFILYRNIALQLMESVNANNALFAYKQIQPLDTFIARTLTEFILASLIYLVIIAGFAWYGFDVSIVSPLEWAGTLAVGLCFAFGLGMAFAILVNAVPDARTFVRMAFLPIYLISGVIYPPSYMSPAWLPWLLWNPFLHIVELLRKAVFPFYEVVDGVSMGYVASVTAAFLFIGLGFYRVRRLKLKAVR